MKLNNRHKLYRWVNAIKDISDLAIERKEEEAHISLAVVMERLEFTDEDLAEIKRLVETKES